MLKLSKDIKLENGEENNTILSLKNFLNNVKIKEKKIEGDKIIYREVIYNFTSYHEQFLKELMNYNNY